MMKTKRYEREMAIQYAHKWAYKRNPKYYDFSELGGDCTNFTSQCLYAGGGVMNHTQTRGWYYYSLNNRAPAWTGVNEFYRFLTSNSGPGPYAVETGIQKMQPGDFIQLSFDGEIFRHCVIIVSAGDVPSVKNIQVAAHTFDTDNRPLNTYIFQKMRCLHIQGVFF
jgi:hypothetical protein